MLEDRSYMRQESWRSQWSLTFLLILANVAVFAVQEINKFYLKYPLDYYFALSNKGLSHGYIWQLLTFQFLHADGWHLVFNMLGLFFFGRVVEQRLGKSAFLKIYFLSGTIGGLFQALLGWILPQHFGISVVGASAGVLGLLAASAVLDPNALIFVSFILPIRAKYVLYIVAAVSIFYIFVPNSRIAHAAHLGGLLTGVAYVRWGYLAEDWWADRRRRSWSRRRELTKVRLPKSAPWGRAKASPEDLPPAEFISREVDPILDKISAHGLQSLTPRERKILEAAREKMERR